MVVGLLKQWLHFALKRPKVQVFSKDLMLMKKELSGWETKVTNLSLQNIYSNWFYCRKGRQSPKAVRKKRTDIILNYLVKSLLQALEKLMGTRVGVSWPIERTERSKHSS